MKHFILMADVIGSSNMPSQALITEFKKLVKACNSVFAASLESPLTITLGDEFQCVVKDLNSAVKILFYLEEYCIHNRFNLGHPCFAVFINLFGLSSRVGLECNRLFCLLS